MHEDISWRGRHGALEDPSLPALVFKGSWECRDQSSFLGKWSQQDSSQIGWHDGLSCVGGWGADGIGQSFGQELKKQAGGVPYPWRTLSPHLYPPTANADPYIYGWAFPSPLHTQRSRGMG